MVVVTALTGTLAVVELAGASPGARSAPPTAIDVWRHDGTTEENEEFTALLDEFESEQATLEDPIHVTVRTIAEGDYNNITQAAGAARGLPDLVEVDGPNVASYAYQQMLRPLDGLVDDSVLADQIPSLRQQGTWRGHTWGVGVFDSGLGIYASRSALERAGVRIPLGISDAWTAPEFAEVLAALARHDPDGKVLDLKRDYGVGEWLTYGFAPLVASAGGSLLDPATGRASGFLDGEPAITALTALSSWAPYVDPDADGAAFTSGRVALSWVGHWTYPDYAAALGDDLVVVPLPDLGTGTKTGQGSWAWGVSAGSTEPDAAATFLRFLLEPDHVLAMTEANGAVPGTREALSASALYSTDGPLHLFALQLLASCSDAPGRTCVSVARPMTPAYPALTGEFSRAVDDALSGGDFARALRRSAKVVDADSAASLDWR